MLTSDQRILYNRSWTARYLEKLTDRVVEFEAGLCQASEFIGCHGEA